MASLVRSLRQPARRRSVSQRYHLLLLILLLPYLVGALLLIGVPLAATLGLSLTSYDGLSEPTWRGLANYQDVLRDPLFLVAAQNSLLFVLITIPARLLLTLTLALLLLPRRRGVPLYRAAIYLPTIVPGVANAMIWLWIFNPFYGPLNLVLAAIGLPTPAWLANPTTALPALALMAIFQIGEGFVVLLAGLQEIPRSYHDAAALDGAGRWARFRHITLPLVAPWLLLITIRDIIANAQTTFAPALIMTGGGPYYATLFVPLLLYQTAFDRLRFGMGAAMTALLIIGVALLIGLAYVCLGGWGYEDDVEA
ncbi:MAG: sugar ABC transporter permease [Roseiflexaceae bacterium]